METQQILKLLDIPLDLTQMYFDLSDAHEMQYLHEYKAQDYDDDFITALEEEFSIYLNPIYIEFIEIAKDVQAEVQQKIHTIELNYPELFL